MRFIRRRESAASSEPSAVAACAAGVTGATTERPPLRPLRPALLPLLLLRPPLRLPLLLASCAQLGEAPAAWARAPVDSEKSTSESSRIGLSEM